MADTRSWIRSPDEQSNAVLCASSRLPTPPPGLRAGPTARPESFKLMMSPIDPHTRTAPCAGPGMDKPVSGIFTIDPIRPDTPPPEPQGSS
ncbi:hypothetical protein Z517_01703 [Fonsecaea pedrosoi CBS 271.37]|uniref:Uncharacterized protein n=1 Tax=Fonsecaea pedrosoi CBS 271.37 TaxID=1442368 RepID=A0A0D2FHY8_9EURO|nr:uncharacterized protein Z517_01703 [Fonsecaea pedrosoi CBS 271.37]KIW86307.1 hypothetical protein Z517_01703 [Fonsecaea pedrosoi CBS 271.37]